MHTHMQTHTHTHMHTQTHTRTYARSRSGCHCSPADPSLMLCAHVACTSCVYTSCVYASCVYQVVLWFCVPRRSGSTSHSGFKRAAVTHLVGMVTAGSECQRRTKGRPGGCTHTHTQLTQRTQHKNATQTQNRRYTMC